MAYVVSVACGFTPAYRGQNLLQYFHLFLVAGVGSKHGAKGACNGEANVPSFDPTPDVVEGTVSSRHDRQRPEEVGRAERGTAEAQAWTLND